MSKMYYQGETMRQDVEIRNLSKALVDPDTIVISVVDPEETVKVDEVSMTKDATGKYHHSYQLESDAEMGKWKTEVKAVKGFTQIEQDEFTVMEAI